MERLYWRVGAACLGAWLVLAVFFGETVLQFAERFLSGDGEIVDGTAVLVKLTAALAGAWLLLPIAWLTWRPRPLLHGLRAASGPERLQALALPVLLAAFAYAWTTWGPWLTVDRAGWLAPGTLHGEDGLLENLTALLAVAAAIVFVATLPRLGRASRVLAAAVAVAAFLFGMEEISWGQRLFGLESPPVFAEKNVQSELNFHNFLSPRIVHVYAPAAVGLALAAWFCFAPRLARFLPADLHRPANPPHRLFLSIAFQVLAVQSVAWKSAEVMEEFLALLLFTSAWLLARDRRRVAAARAAPPSTAPARGTPRRAA